MAALLLGAERIKRCVSLSVKIDSWRARHDNYRSESRAFVIILIWESSAFVLQSHFFDLQGVVVYPVHSALVLPPTSLLFSVISFRFIRSGFRFHSVLVNPSLFHDEVVCTMS